MQDHSRNGSCFPSGFVWGAATSAYQIEGAVDVEGRVSSVWDTFCEKPGNIRNGDTGRIACDHYSRFREDVALMREIGIPAYRLSVSWPRIMPEGSGVPNEKGLGFYDRLIDELLSAGIEPWVTLFHWDFPQYLADRGGWLNPECVQWFRSYVAAVVERLSDRVRNWITINEPQAFLEFGHATATNAPGLRLSLPDQLLAAHHVLLSHGNGAQVIHERASKKPVIGWAPVGITYAPETEAPNDVWAAREATTSVREAKLWNNVWFNDPVFCGHYPEDGLEVFGSAVPKWSAKEMECISTPINFLGLNTYTASVVRAVGDDSWEEVARPEGYPRTAFDWPVCEDCLYWGSKFHAERYKKPIYITENGLANTDWVSQDGEVHDPQRIDFLARHLSALERCIDEGVDVKGYFHWSLLDNFEWAEGYGRRFGLIFVDFQTQQRIMKDSAHWFRAVIRSNGSSILNGQELSGITSRLTSSELRKELL